MNNEENGQTSKWKPNEYQTNGLTKTQAVLNKQITIAIPRTALVFSLISIALGTTKCRGRFCTGSCATCDVRATSRARTPGTPFRQSTINWRRNWNNHKQKENGKSRGSTGFQSNRNLLWWFLSDVIQSKILLRSYLVNVERELSW